MKKFIKYAKYFLIIESLVILNTILIDKIVFGQEICKRPHWKYKYVEKERCMMDIRNYMLYVNSYIPATIEYVYHKNIKIPVCVITGGLWKIVTKNGVVNKINKSDIHIDHVIPYKWLKNQLKDCDKARFVYNYEPNLQLKLADENQQKKDKTCYNKYTCQLQKQICLKMNEDFKEFDISFNCGEL